MNRKRKKRRTSNSARGTTQPFSLLIKPAGPDCNLRCRYCFYLSKSELFTAETTADATGPLHPLETETSKKEKGKTPGVHRMSDEVLETLISSYMQTLQPVYAFNWQGGEPTLMGLDFFERVVELQKKYGAPGSTVSNTLQTNATLIDADWARFLAKYSVLTGVSLDGPQEIHDTYRKDAGGNGTFGRVMAGIEHLRAAGAEFNILSMVTYSSEGEARRIFDFFEREELGCQQYIPCVEFDSGGRPLPYTVSPEGWGCFLVDLFHRWYPDHVHGVSVRNFDNIVNFMATGELYSCTMAGACDRYFVVEHEGGVYPCDFFVEPRFRLGSVMEDGWEALRNSPVYRAFASQKSRWNEECSSCEYLELCSGDCIKMRFRTEASRNPRSLSYLCSGHRKFFDETLPRFTELGRDVRRRFSLSNDGFYLPPISRSSEEPCFCGSGRKYKNCHNSGSTGEPA